MKQETYEYLNQKVERFEGTSKTIKELKKIIGELDHVKYIEFRFHPHTQNGFHICPQETNTPEGKEVMGRMLKAVLNTFGNELELEVARLERELEEL